MRNLTKFFVTLETWRNLPKFGEINPRTAMLDDDKHSSLLREGLNGDIKLL
jgi:hypothetical protein